LEKGMPTYRLTVEYDGTKFAGWQVQRHGRTVQGVLLEALRRTTGERDIVLRGAGRTDAGVHALGQVASLQCRRPVPAARLLGQLERELPADVAVRDVELLEGRFHPRHDAVRRSYRYQIARRRSAFGKRCTWWVRDPLDSAAMMAAAAEFVGRHDFVGFSRRDEAQTSTIVVVEECRVVDLGELVLVRIIASHFLWGQVRRMVGALVAVGCGQWGPQAVRDWLAGAAVPAFEAAPAAGLFLEAVIYKGGRDELPALVPVGVPWVGQAANLRSGVGRARGGRRSGQRSDRGRRRS
jgi:tRNA pseudouridine38-40 synthase